jgi:hypothetical protein
MFALDGEDIATGEDERMKRLSHPGTFDFMHRARNGNNTIQDVTQSALQHCDGLGSSLQAMMGTFSEYHNALSNTYDAHASINENSNSSGLR